MEPCSCNRPGSKKSYACSGFRFPISSFSESVISGGRLRVVGTTTRSISVNAALILRRIMAGHHGLRALSAEVPVSSICFMSILFGGMYTMPESLINGSW